MNQPSTSDNSKSIENPDQSVQTNEAEQDNIDMMDSEALKSEETKINSPVQTKTSESPPEPPSTPTTSKCEELSSEKEYERMLLKRIYKNLVLIWEAIEKYEVETSINNTSGTSTNSATSQSTLIERCNDAHADVVSANASETPANEQSTSEQQT